MGSAELTGKRGVVEEWGHRMWRGGREERGEGNSFRRIFIEINKKRWRTDSNRSNIKLNLMVHPMHKLHRLLCPAANYLESSPYFVALTGGFVIPTGNRTVGKPTHSRVRGTTQPRKIVLSTTDDIVSSVHNASTSFNRPSTRMSIPKRVFRCKKNDCVSHNKTHWADCVLLPLLLTTYRTPRLCHSVLRVILVLDPSVLPRDEVIARL